MFNVFLPTSRKRELYCTTFHAMAHALQKPMLMVIILMTYLSVVNPAYPRHFIFSSRMALLSRSPLRLIQHEKTVVQCSLMQITTAIRIFILRLDPYRG